MTIRKSEWNERKKVTVGTKACVRLKKGVDKERRRWNMRNKMFVRIKAEKVFKINVWDKVKKRRCLK
jgi:hypothetical protein